MTEISTEMIGRLVVRRKQDGRCVYDPQVKAQIVRACLQPGVSVARMALQCGVNANLLRRWVGERHKPGSSKSVVLPLGHANSAEFVPVRIQAPSAEPASCVQIKMELHARLPNGVALDLQPASLDDLKHVIAALGGLTCSAWTRE